MSPLWVSYHSMTSQFPPFAFVEYWFLASGLFSLHIIKRTLIYTVAGRYEFYVRVARTISHSFAALTREILFLPLEHKIHIFSPPCNILYLLIGVSVCLSFCPSACLSVCLSVCPTVPLSIHRFCHQSVCLPVCLSVYLISIWHF